MSVPAVVRREAGERAGQLLAAGADDAGNAQDLAGMQLEVDVAVGAREAKPSRLDEHLVATGLLQRLAVIFGLQAATDHQPVQRVDVGVGRGRSATTAPSFIT